MASFISQGFNGFNNSLWGEYGDGDFEDHTLNAFMNIYRHFGRYDSFVKLEEGFDIEHAYHSFNMGLLSYKTFAHYHKLIFKQGK